MKHDPDDLPPQFRRPDTDLPHEVAEIFPDPPPETPDATSDGRQQSREEPFLRKDG